MIDKKTSLDMIEHMVGNKFSKLLDFVVANLPKRAGMEFLELVHTMVDSREDRSTPIHVTKKYFVDGSGILRKHLVLRIPQSERKVIRYDFTRGSASKFH